MGLLDVLSNIDPQIIAASMAAMSKGDQAVPNTMRAIEWRRAQDEALRKEKEAKAREAETSHGIAAFYQMLANRQDPTLDLLMRSNEVASMPDTVQGVQPGYGMEAGQYDPNAEMGQAPMVEQENTAKKEAEQNFMADVIRASKQKQPLANAAGLLLTKYKNIDPKIASQMLGLAYQEDQEMVQKMVDIASKMQLARENKKKEKTDLKSIDPTHDVYIGGKLVKEGKAKPETGKGVNMPPAYDLVGMAVLGEAYHTPEGQRQFANMYASDPRLQKKVNEEIIKQQAQARFMGFPPIYNFVQTSEGIVPGNVRTGQTGSPTGYGKPIPSDQVTAQQQVSTLREALGQVKNLYKPEYVGPIAGRVAGVKEKTVGVDSKQAVFNSALAQAKNSLVYLLSGKQINETEYKRLEQQLPSKELPPGVFKARLLDFERTLNSIVENKSKALQGAGYGNQGREAPNQRFQIIEVK